MYWFYVTIIVIILILIIVVYFFFVYLLWCVSMRIGFSFRGNIIAEY